MSAWGLSSVLGCASRDLSARLSSSLGLFLYLGWCEVSPGPAGCHAPFIHRRPHLLRTPQVFALPPSPRSRTRESPCIHPAISSTRGSRTAVVARSVSRQSPPRFLLHSLVLIPRRRSRPPSRSARQRSPENLPTALLLLRSRKTTTSRKSHTTSYASLFVRPILHTLPPSSVSAHLLFSLGKYCNPWYSDYQRAYHPSLLSRSRTSLSRLRKLSQASLKKSREVIGRTRRRSTGSDHPNPLAIAIRRPSVDSSQSSETSSSPKTPPQSHSILFLDSHPFVKTDPSIEEEHPIIHAIQHVVTEPDDIVFAATPRTPKARSITSSLKRIRTLSRASLFSSARKHAPRVCQVLSPDSESSGTPPRSSSPLESIQIPELVFEQIDLSVVLEDDRPFPSFSLTRIDSVSTSLDPATPRIQVINASPRVSSAYHQLRLPKFQFVDPRSLTASAPASAIEGASLFGSAAPSPAWLSRNVQNLEVNVPVDVTSYSPAPLPIPPPPSPPLYIVPRSLRPDTYYLRGPEVCLRPFYQNRDVETESYLQIEFEFTTAPQTPQSTSSSLTLYNPSQRDSFLASSSIVRPRPASANRLSVVYRRSIVDNRRSIHSVVSYSEEREGQDVIRVCFILLYHVPLH